MTYGSRTIFRFGIALTAVLLVGVAQAGGYVPPNGTLLTEATSIAISGSSTITPTFNNATLTNQNTIAETNNNPIKTPSTADPVSTVTGNNYHDETDFVIKGRAGLNYAFTRTYNSAPSATATDIGLGYGWVHSYAMRLNSNDYGACPNCTSAQAVENGNGKTSSITYTDERGGDHNYLVNETTYAITPPQGEFDSLVFDTPVVGQHTLTFRNGTKYIFQTVTGTLKTTPGLTARLLQIADPFGNQLNFTYNAAGFLATVTDNLGISGRTGLVFNYDASNHLSSITDWTGRNWGYTVDSSGNLVSYTNPMTQSLTYTYSGANNHNLYQIIKQLRGVQTAFSYYQNGRTFNYQNNLPTPSVETIDYDLYRKSTSVTDARGGDRAYEYDASGRMTKLTEPNGAVLMFQNTTTDGLRYSKTDGLGYITQYSYKIDKSFNTVSDTFGNVTREQDPLGQTVDTTYGIYDQIATVKDKRGNVITTSFGTTDGTCKLTGKPDTITLSQLTPATGSAMTNVKLVSYCWNSDGTLKSETDYLNPSDATKTRITTPTYDTTAHLNVQSLTVVGWDGTTVTKTYNYDNLGRQKTETLYRRTSPSNTALVALTNSTDYDALDRAIHVYDALGNMMETVYDANGQVYQIIGHYVDGTNRTLSTRGYDAADRLISDTDILGNTAYTTYDPAGNVISVTDRQGHTTRYEYDEMNHRTAVIDPNGYRTTTIYDLAGHPISVTNGNGETMTTTYDAIGRVLQVTDPLGYITTYSYDANGNLTCVIDANAQTGLQPKNSNGCTVFTTYDELNRPTQVKDALNNITKTSYDLVNNITSIIDANTNTTSYAYDGLGRLNISTDPLSKTTIYTRDEAGNAWQVTNRLNQLTQATFDLLNRPTQVNYLTDGSTENTFYDAFGNKHIVSNATVTYTFGYDTKNRLKSKLDSRSDKSLSFTYDNADNILTKTDFQGDITSYTYDSANQRTAMKNSAYLEASYQHDGARRVLSRILSDGAQTQYGYNADGQLTSLKTVTANGTVLSNLGYTRDRLGNILTQTDANGTIGYTYDALYRLTNTTAPTSTESFSYDAVGNRNVHTLGVATHAYEYYPGSNRIKALHTTNLAGAVEKSFVYDDEGRLTSQAGSQPKGIAWDQKNRATSINGVNYSYDPMDYRLGQTAGLLGNRTYYLEGEHLEAEYSGTILQAKYFRGLSTDELVAGYSYDSTGNWSPAIYHHDALMSVTGISAHDGTPIQTATYSAFGDRTITATGTSTNRLTYTGREQDLDSGLYYYRARYYDPTIGRFLSEDSLGFRQGVNFYAYVQNNPINGNDPTGQDTNCGVSTCTFSVPGAFTTTPFPRPPNFPDQINSDSSFYHLYPTTVPVTNSSLSIGQLNAGLAANPTPGNTLPATTQGTLNDATPSAMAPTINYFDGDATNNNNPVMSYLVNDTATGAQIVLNVTQPGHALFPGVVAEYVSGTSDNLSMNYVGEGTAGIESTVNPFAEPAYNWLWTTQANGIMNGLSGGTAAGGFLIYPNKPNTNQVQSVYSK